MTNGGRERDSDCIFLGGYRRNTGKILKKEGSVKLKRSRV